MDELPDEELTKRILMNIDESDLVHFDKQAEQY
jgi:hypothetical protein